MMNLEQDHLSRQRQIVSIKRESEFRGLILRIVYPKHCCDCNRYSSYQFHTDYTKFKENNPDVILEYDNWYLIYYHCWECLTPIEKYLVYRFSKGFVTIHVQLRNEIKKKSNLIPVFKDNVFQKWREIK